MTAKFAQELMEIVDVFSELEGKQTNFQWRGGLLAGLQAQFVDPDELPDRLKDQQQHTSEYDRGWYTGYRTDVSEIVKNQA